MQLIWLVANLLVAAVFTAAKRLEHVQVNYTVWGPWSNSASADIDPWLRPIRIHIHEVDYSLALDSQLISFFRKEVVLAVERASRLLKVFPVAGPLHLSRDVTRLCNIRLPSDPNKCQVRWDFDPSENCGVDGDFRIPAEHYEDFLLYSNNPADKPEVDIAGGDGLADTDIVVYMSVSSIQYCNVDNAGVLAFTKICKRDQFGRPIASFINVCTSEVSTVSAHKLSETLFHEMLHALGLVGSSLLFFLESCKIDDGELNCQFLEPNALSPTMHLPREILQDRTTDEDERYEMVGDYAHSAWAYHVNCHNYHFSDRGAAWMTFRDSDDNKITAGDHWVLQSMMGSIMSPLIREPYMQVLDNLTIAVFKDMGWYSVSDNYTEPYLWGNNSGCYFSDFSYCTNVTEGKINDRFYCATSGDTGCHYLHLHKGTCDSIKPPHPCQYYKPTEACFVEAEGQEGSLETFCTDCRCFMSADNQVDSVLEQALCLERRCVDGLLDVRINGQWINCPYNQTIAISAVDRMLHCPPSDVLCTERDLRLPELLDSVEPNAVTTTQAFPQTRVPKFMTYPATADTPSAVDGGLILSSAAAIHWSSFLTHLLWCSFSLVLIWI